MNGFLAPSLLPTTLPPVCEWLNVTTIVQANKSSRLERRRINTHLLMITLVSAVSIDSS